VPCIPEERYASVAIKLSGSTHVLIFAGIKHVRKVSNLSLVRKSHKIISLSLFSLWLESAVAFPSNLDIT